MKRAFTLIELLIVIAIIAILALIAVPNFLEAQVRAKVSRVHADMRTMATAIEAYSVDWGRPPVDTYEYKNNLGFTSMNDQTVQRVLTTPVAYVGRGCADPFIEKGYINQSGGTHTTNKPYRLKTFIYLGTSGRRQGASGNGFLWSLRTLGPARTSVHPETGLYVDVTRMLSENINWLYDATNGTLSWGLIVRTNKGVMDGALLNRD